MCLSREVKGNKVDRQPYFITIAHTDKQVESIEALFRDKPICRLKKLSREKE